MTHGLFFPVQSKQPFFVKIKSYRKVFWAQTGKSIDGIGDGDDNNVVNLSYERTF